jgi:predicted transcriptional regulator
MTRKEKLIYESPSGVISLADVLHVEKRKRRKGGKIEENGLMAVTSGTIFCQEMDEYHNAFYIPQEEAEDFIERFTKYKVWAHEQKINS